MSRDDSEASLRLIVAESHRIKSLHIALHNKVLESVFGALEEGRFYAPNLESLKLKVVSRPHYTFPQILSRDLLPKLSHVALHGFIVPYNIPFLRSSLTSLVIRYNTGMAQVGPDFLATNMKELLFCLSHMSQLRVLYVSAKTCNCQGMSTDSLVHSAPSIELPCLEKVSMTLHRTFVNAFVAKCKFPLSAQAFFDTTVQGTQFHQPVTKVDTLSSILLHSMVLPTKAEHESNPPTTGLSFIFHYRGTGAQGQEPVFEVTILTHQQDFRFEDKGSALSTQSLPPHHFGFRFNDWASHAMVLLESLLQVPLHKLAYLDVTMLGRELEPIGSQLGMFVLELVQRCSGSRLELLRLGGCGTDILLHLLTPSIPSEGDLYKGYERGTLFNHIQTLIVNNEDVISGRLFNEPDPDGTRLSSLCSAIQSQVPLHKWSCGTFTNLTLECIKESYESLEDLVNSFSELFDQYGRLTSGDEIIFENKDDRKVPETRRQPLPIDGNADLVFAWPESVPLRLQAPPFSRSTLRWMDHMQRDRVVFDFKGNVGLRIVHLD